MSLSPNPAECVWIGPLLSDLNCSTCILGYETNSTDDTTCIKPKFRPYREWEASAERQGLELQDANGITVKPDESNSTLVTILTEQTYTIPAPKLVPKERKFVGYTQPYMKIFYELDFVGSEVDIGCGTAVVGNGAGDGTISKNEFAHPSSMHRFSYQWVSGRGNLEADPIEAGYYPQRCPRYHRFEVKHAGLFTFDTCASMMNVGINIYKRTDDLTESEPRMTKNWTIMGGQHFEVPLHANDEEYTKVTTGLVRVQPARMGKGFVDWLNGFRDKAFPPVVYPEHATMWAANGCPYSFGAHRTYNISQLGEYFLETQTASPMFTCDNFNIKMTCSNGAQAASPADTDPLGFSVDPETGAITGTPVNVGKGYRMHLRAVDADDVRTTVANWTFDVETPDAFKLNPSAEWSMKTDGKLARKYHVNETHLLPKPSVSTTKLLLNPAGGAFDKVVYLLSAHPAANNPNCTVVNISALTDVTTGEGAINIKCEGNYSARLVARDGAGQEVELRSWWFEVLRRDTDVPAYGPGGFECANGDPVDEVKMNGVFTCDCSATKFTGNNCDIPADVPEQDNTTVYVIVAVLAVLGLGAVVIALLVRYQRYQQSLMATDFLTQLQTMKEEGLVDPDQISTERVPRELKRGWLSFIDKLGQGQFGEVWKGLLNDDNVNIPEYMVAAKTVKEAESNDVTVMNEGDLMREALLMAQVEPHRNLVSIIGVITRGRPKTLVRACVFDHETSLIVLFSTAFERVAPCTPASASFIISTFAGQRGLKHYCCVKLTSRADVRSSVCYAPNNS